MHSQFSDRAMKKKNFRMKDTKPPMDDGLRQQLEEELVDTLANHLADGMNESDPVTDKDLEQLISEHLYPFEKLKQLVSRRRIQ